MSGMTRRWPLTGWYLAVGAFLVAAAPFLPAVVQHALYVLVGLSALVAILVGVRRYRPARVRSWYLLGACVVLGLSASLWWAVDLAIDGVRMFPTGGDVLYTLMPPLMAISVTGWARTGPRRGGLVEACVVATGAASVVWAFVADPLLSTGRVTGLLLESYLLYITFDLVILALVVRIVLITRVRTPAYRLMVAGGLVMIGTDLAFYATSATGSSPAAITASGYLATYLLLGAAALHPSMAQALASSTAEPTPVSRTRIVGYVVLILACGAVTALSLATDHRPTLPHIVVPVFLASLMAILLVVRLGELAALLDRRAAVDSLTGLGNITRLRAELALRAGRSHEADLLLIDLDGFRDVNDSFGHFVGDGILREVADRLRALTAGHRATLLRLGGDEFAILLDRAPGGADIADAQYLAEMVGQAIRQPYSVPDGGTVTLTASIGALPLAPGVSVDDSLRQADLALFAAQAAGGDQVEVYDAELHAARQARTRLVASLHRAVADGEFTVHYQPIVDLASGGIIGAEALLRWTMPDGTRVSPAEFIPVAEQSGAVVPIGAWVIRQVCADLREWHRRYGISVTVNVSARQLRQPDFAQTVLAALRDAGLPGEALIVELTETGLITAHSDVIHLQTLREHGVRVAIDDFGTGYSSLAYLRQLPVDLLKMDGSFTAHQVQRDDPRDRVFIRAIVELAGSLGLRTVAEAVETAEQAERLRLLGCDLAQGYYFARPAPAADLSARLAQRDGQLSSPGAVAS